MNTGWRWTTTGLAALIGLLLMSCGPTGPMTEEDYRDLLSCGPERMESPLTRKVTYEADIKPMLETHCNGCHNESGNAPFRFETYEKASALGTLLAHVTKTRRMPPWAPADCCNTYLKQRRLTPNQIAQIQTWVRQGKPRGTPRSEAPQREEKQPLRRDIVLKMPKPFRPQKQFGVSELRCFMLDWPHKDQRFVTGFDVRPGDPRLVHHILVHIIPPEHVESYLTKGGKDGRQGWDCYGQGFDLRKGVGIGGWAPGIGAVRYPEGIGIPIAPGSKIMLNIHYDLSQGDGVDQTSIAFRLERQIERRAYNFGISHPQWLLTDGMRIEAEEAMTRHHMRMDLNAVLGKETLTLYAINLHMHERGKRGSVVLERADGTRECLLHIPEFPFLWQETYTLKQPITLRPGDKIYLECRWDNAARNQPVVEGKKAESKTIGWGTDQEMCTAFVLLAEGEES